MEQCTCNPRKHGEFFVNGKLICIYCRNPVEDADKMADLEAANILLNNTINVQLQVIREHEAADVIAVEAIRSQAEEIKLLKEKISNLYDAANEAVGHVGAANYRERQTEAYEMIEKAYST